MTRPAGDTAPLSDRPEGELLSVTQAAERAGVSRGVVWGWIIWGHLPAIHKGRRLDIHLVDLMSVQEAAPWRLVESRGDPVWSLDAMLCSSGP